mgnify:CR=1 FL=1
MRGGMGKKARQTSRKASKTVPVAEQEVVQVNQATAAAQQSEKMRRRRFLWGYELDHTVLDQAGRGGVDVLAEAGKDAGAKAATLTPSNVTGQVTARQEAVEALSVRNSYDAEWDEIIASNIQKLKEEGLLDEYEIAQVKNQLLELAGRGELVEKCIADLRATAAYEPYEIVVIDHESDEPRLREYLASESVAGRLRVFPYRGPFNYAAMNNAAIRHTDGDFVLLLNNDVDGFSPGWLDQLVATMELDRRIAAVGALLHYPDGSIQHAGVILTPKRPCIAAHAGLPHDALGYQGRIRSLQEFSAVTAACMLVRRSAFEEVSGFDEEIGRAHV